MNVSVMIGAQLFFMSQVHGIFREGSSSSFCFMKIIFCGVELKQRLRWIWEPIRGFASCRAGRQKRLASMPAMLWDLFHAVIFKGHLADIVPSESYVCVYTDPAHSVSTSYRLIDL